MAPEAKSAIARSFLKRGPGVPTVRHDVFLIAVILFVVDAFAGALLYYVYYPQRRREASAKAATQLALLARDRQQAVAGWARERVADADLGASLLATSGDFGPGGATALLERFVRTSDYESAFVIDDAGSIVVRAGSAETDDATVVAFARDTTSEGVAKIDFRRTRRHVPKVLTARHFAKANGSKRAAVLLIADPVKHLYAILSTFPGFSRTGETNLIGLYGDLGVALSPYPGEAPPTMTHRQRIPRAYAAEALATGEKTVQYIDRRGMSVIGVVKTIPLTPWIVVVKLDEEEVVAGALAETVRLAWLLAFISLTLATTSFVILRSRRVHQLRLAKDQLARLFANSTTGILVLQVIFDEAGTPVDHEVVDMNPAAEQLLGVDASDELGKRSGDAAYLQWPAEIRARNYRVAVTGGSDEYEHFSTPLGRWFDTRVFSPRRAQFAQLLLDISERKKTEVAMRNLSARLLRVQDDANRRIARQLHETVAQALAAIRMSLTMIKKSPGDQTNLSTLLDESLRNTDEAITEIRTLSYLLHPPMVDRAGLHTALRWYVEGFQQRSGIATTLHVPRDLDQLPRDVETSVFRIVQESLSNIQRHSHSETASIVIDRLDHHLSIEIADRGRGLPPGLRDHPDALLASGVGIAGMNERVHELGGEMSVSSTDFGTTVSVTLPLGLAERVRERNGHTPC